MSVQYFFYSGEWSNNILVLPKEESTHCVRSCRFCEGDIIGLTSGHGKLALARICAISKNLEVSVLLDENSIQNFPPPTPVRLFMSVLQDHDRMEWMVEKATELGATEINFLITDRTIKKRLRPDRMQRIAIAALKQSGRPWLTNIHEPVPFQNMTWPQGHSFIAFCFETKYNPKIHYSEIKITTADSINVFIGPEGDFTESEIHEAIQKGAVPLSLGLWRLRSETAAILSLIALRKKF